MKSVLAASALSAVMLTSVSCGSTSDKTQPMVAQVLTEPAVVSYVSQTSGSAVTTSVTASGTSASLTYVSSTAVPSSETTAIENILNPEYAAAEVSMLEAVGNPDYNGEVAIPYVGWTEVNLSKTMYPINQCIGYEFALPDAAPKMRYDAGIALEVIARTSTGYYRLRGDYYIPCDYLDTVVHEGADPAAATSCAIVTLPVSVTAVPEAETTTIPDIPE